jgi:hypothetical protein
MIIPINIYDHTSLNSLEKEIFQKKVVEKKTYIYVRLPLLFGNCADYENVEKYCTVRQATDDNMAQAHCVLNT